MTFAYAAYGLTIHAPFPLDSLAESADNSQPDVVIREGVVHDSLPNPSASGPNWQAAPGSFYWGGGRFCLSLIHI